MKISIFTDRLHPIEQLRSIVYSLTVVLRLTKMNLLKIDENAAF